MNSLSHNPSLVPPPRTVLVLGGGGMKGMAHLGVWKALTEKRIRIDAVVGTSIGALMGGLIASGASTTDLLDAAKHITKGDILRLNKKVLWGGLKRESIFSGEHYKTFIRESLPYNRFDQLQIPLRVNAVSLLSGKEQWFGIGKNNNISLTDAIYASCSIPLYFPPLRWQSDYLVDGGVTSSLAVHEAVDWGASNIIAVDVRADLRPLESGAIPSTMMAIHDRVLTIVGTRRRQEDINMWEALGVTYIRPDVGRFDVFDFENTPFFIERGYEAAVESINTSMNNLS